MNILDYDKNEKERSYGIQSELAYLPVSWVALGVNGLCQMRGKAKSSANTYNWGLGISIRFSF